MPGTGRRPDGDRQDRVHGSFARRAKAAEACGLGPPHACKTRGSPDGRAFARQRRMTPSRTRWIYSGIAACAALSAGCEMPVDDFKFDREDAPIFTRSEILP